MTVEDWRDLPSRALAGLYAGERARALRTLQWDYAPIWHEVEQARTTWGLPGFVARDRHGRLRGMAFYVQDGGRLDIGGIVSDDARATGALLDAIRAVADVNGRCVVRMLVFDTAAGLGSSLTARGFDVEPHFYLCRPLRAASGSGPAAAFTTWHPADIGRAAALLRRAYDPAAGSLFAANNRPEEWERYVTNLVTHPGCGRWNPQATVTLREGGELAAIAMITDIAPQVAHIVQLAVDAAHRRRHIGRALVDEACARLAARGYRAVTLLVAASNRAARALYDATAFRQDATFLGATLAAEATPPGQPDAAATEQRQ